MPSVLDIFDGERDRKQTYLNDIWIPFACGLTGFGAACFVNWTTRRPVFSGDVTSIITSPHSCCVDMIILIYALRHSEAFAVHWHCGFVW